MRGAAFGATGFFIEPEMGEIIKDARLFRCKGAADLCLKIAMFLAQLLAERFAKFKNALMTLLGQLQNHVFLFLTQFKVAIQITG